MNAVETKQVLAVLKAAYPNAFKGMTREEAFGMINVWAMQFAQIPADLVLAAVNRLVAKSNFVPSVAEVNEELRGIYWDSFDVLRFCATYDHVGAKELAEHRRVVAALEHLEDRKPPAALTQAQAALFLNKGATQCTETTYSAN